MNIIKEALNQLNELAFGRSKVFEKANKFTDTIEEHLLKCTVYYDNSLLDYWIGEIADKCEIINGYKFNNDHRLKKSEYQELFTDQFGTDIADSELDLRAYKSINKNKPDFINFEITLELINKFRKTEDLFIDKLSSIFSTKNDYVKEDFIPVVKEIIEKCN